MSLWTQGLLTADLESLRNLRYRYKGRYYDVSLVVFADDAKRMFATLLGADLRTEVKIGMETLDQVLVLQQGGLKRNLDKGEALVQHRGRGQMLLNSALTHRDDEGQLQAQWPGGKPATSAKHLGTFQHISCSHTTEQRRRSAAAREGYAKFSRYLSKTGV